MLLHGGAADRVEPAKVTDGARPLKRPRDDAATRYIAEREEDVGANVVIRTHNPLVVGYTIAATARLPGRCAGT